MYFYGGYMQYDTYISLTVSVYKYAIKIMQTGKDTILVSISMTPNYIMEPLMHVPTPNVSIFLSV